MITTAKPPSIGRAYRKRQAIVNRPPAADGPGIFDKRDRSKIVP